MSLIQEKSVKTTVYIDSAVYGKIINRTKQSPYPNQTQVIHDLLNRAFELEKEISELKHMNELVSLQSMFILRELVKLRGEEFVQDIDNRFENELPNLKEHILKKGVFYAT